MRIDYGKLRHLLLTGRQLNGNFDLLRHVIAEGRAHSDIVESFPLARLTYGYLRDAYRDVGVFSLNLVEFDRVTRRMALEGDWRQ